MTYISDDPNDATDKRLEDEVNTLRPSDVTDAMREYGAAYLRAREELSQPWWKRTLRRIRRWARGHFDHHEGENRPK